LEENERSTVTLEEVKRRISEISLKPLDTHSLEFEGIHSDLSKILAEIDGL